MKMLIRLLLVVCSVSVLALASPTGEKDDNRARPIHIIKPPVRCPEGMKPDANGRCRVVWERNVKSFCPEGEEPDEDGVCRRTGESSSSECFGDECQETRKVGKRDIGEMKYEDQTKEEVKQFTKQKTTETSETEKKVKKRSNSENGKANKKARSKHAFLIMLKKKKMQMMKPKPPPPPPPPPPHHPPHHHPPHHEESEEPEEEPEEEEPPAPERLFFNDEACVETRNSSKDCQPDAEMVEDVEANNEFKEWKPEKSSESSSSSDSSGESESDGDSGDSENEVLEKAIKIKLMKLFRMKQRYGPALRRWLANQLREYEDRKEKKEIISTRCLEAVKETMEVIKDSQCTEFCVRRSDTTILKEKCVGHTKIKCINVSNALVARRIFGPTQWEAVAGAGLSDCNPNLEVEGLFTTSGNLRTRKKIQSYLSRGDIYTLRNWGFEFVVECAAALKIFLQNLPQPLIPIRIQQLVIAENSGVPEKTIANDALGLLKEEVNGRHKELLLEVFTFLKEAAVKVNTSELTGCNLPLKLLPVFFDIESNDPQKFRDIATVFHEIIMEAPEHLKTPCRKIPSGELKIIERILSHDMRVPRGPMTDGRNQPTGESAEMRIPVPRVPHTRLHPWLGRAEHFTSA